MSVLAPERPSTLRANTDAPTSPVRALEDLDEELAFLFRDVCCTASVTTNGSTDCLSKVTSHTICCSAPV